MSIDEYSMRKRVNPSPKKSGPNGNKIRIRSNLSAELRGQRAAKVEEHYQPCLTMFLVDALERQLPADVASVCLRPRPNKPDKIDYDGVLAVLSATLGLTEPEKIDDLRRAIKQFMQAIPKRMSALRAPEERDMMDLPKALYQVYQRLDPVLSLTGGKLPPVSPQMLNLILNAVRGASERLIPAGHTEGAFDTDTDEVESPLLHYGEKLQHSDHATATGTIQKDVASFLGVLRHYDPTELDDDFTIVRVGTRLLIALSGGPETFFAVFAQLNVARVLDAVLTRDKFMEEMARLEQLAEALAADRKVREMVDQINEEAPPEQKTPTPRRLVSFCRGNRIMAACDAAVAGNLSSFPPQQLIELAGYLTRRGAETDQSFEAIPWYQLAVAAAAAALQDDKLLLAAIRRFGDPAAALVIAGRIRQHFYRPALQAAIDKQLRSMLVGEWQTPQEAAPEKQQES